MPPNSRFSNLHNSPPIISYDDLLSTGLTQDVATLSISTIRSDVKDSTKTDIPRTGLTQEFAKISISNSDVRCTTCNRSYRRNSDGSLRRHNCVEDPSLTVRTGVTQTDADGHIAVPLPLFHIILSSWIPTIRRVPVALRNEWASVLTSCLCLCFCTY